MALWVALVKSNADSVLQVHVLGSFSVGARFVNTKLHLSSIKVTNFKRATLLEYTLPRKGLGVSTIVVCLGSWASVLQLGER